MKIKTDSIRIADVRRISMGRVAALVSRVHRGGTLAAIVVTPERVLISGEHELHAARRMQLVEIDVVVQRDCVDRKVDEP